MIVAECFCWTFWFAVRFADRQTDRQVHIQALRLTNYLLHRSSFRVEWAPVFCSASTLLLASEQVAAGRSTHVAMESRRRELAVWLANLVCVVVVM